MGEAANRELQRETAHHNYSRCHLGEKVFERSSTVHALRKAIELGCKIKEKNPQETVLFYLKRERFDRLRNRCMDVKYIRLSFPFSQGRCMIRVLHQMAVLQQRMVHYVNFFVITYKCTFLLVFFFFLRFVLRKRRTGVRSCITTA